jgi:acetylornithine deacetylase/succinyl-diaminopimelate desuccinylase-like protein
MFTKAVAIGTLLSTASAQTWRGLPGSLYGPSEPWGYAPEASWPPTDLGKDLQPQRPDNLTSKIVAQVDQQRVEDIITKLAGFGTRHTLSIQNSTTRGIGAARDWIYKEMQGYAAESNGSMDVYFNSYIQPVASRISFPVNITNVVAQVNGTTDPNRVYVVTGHYDSRRLDVMDYEGDAPGADDDASGVAVVMEMARICAKLKPKSTMIFAAVAAEEQGLYGSDHLAKTLKEAGYNVEGNWNNDIVGTGSYSPFSEINDYTIRLFGASILYPNASTAAEDRQIGIIGGENDSPARNLGRFIAEVAAGASKDLDMQVALIYRPDRYLRGGDHQSFLTQGFPAVRFTEAVEDYTHQHQNTRVDNGTQYGDLVEFVDFDYTSRVAKVNLATMWSAANAPAMPKNVTISQTIGIPAADEDTPLSVVNNLSAFNWTTGNDPLVSSYELVWRVAGALQWSHSLDVGNTGSVTVDLPKDSLQFGIRVVGRDGKKSPAVFPLPAAR